jgi:hypothetical protein
MAIADVYQADYEALVRVIRKLDKIPDEIESLKVLNAVAVELKNWLPRHNDAEGLEVLDVIAARLSPEGKPLPALLTDFAQVLAQKNAAAAEDIVGGIKFSFADALEGLRVFLESKGIDPEAYAPPPPPPPPPVAVASEELLEPTAIDTAGAPVATETLPDLEPTAARMNDPAPVAAAAPVSVYKCEFCGYEYQTRPGKFCDNCGRALSRLNLQREEEIRIKKCLKCGHRNPWEERLCVNCGELLRDQEL